MTIFRADLLKGKRILVTGGGTGLGREIADEYARLGAEVYICGRRGAVVAETARELAETHNTRVTPIECDIRLPDAVENMMTRVFDEGPLTGLVNNAAGNFISRTKDLSPNGFNAIASIVFHGTFYVTLAAGKRWIEARQQANVVSILTTSVWNGGPFTVPSAMSKAGVNVMTRSLAVEWARHGIRLNAIAPGLFPTKGAGERLNPGSIRAATIDKAHGSSATNNPMGRVDLWGLDDDEGDELDKAVERALKCGKKTNYITHQQSHEASEKAVEVGLAVPKGFAQSCMMFCPLGEGAAAGKGLRSAEKAAADASKIKKIENCAKALKKVNWKSVKQFGHTFSEHGAKRSVQSLIDRARATGIEQGRWLDNQKAAEFLSQFEGQISGPIGVKLPEGLGQVIYADGSIGNAGHAILVPMPGVGLRTAFPIP